MLLLPLLACSDPMASGSPRNLDDGLHITITLTDLDEATLLGRRVTDGQVLVIPYDELPIGYTEVPFEAEGLGPYDSVTLSVGFAKQLAPKCDLEGEWGTVQAEDTSDFFAYKCAVEHGVVAIPMTLPAGAVMELSPGWFEDGVAYFPAAGGAEDIELSTQGSIGAGRAKPTAATVKMTYADGTVWEQAVEVTHRDSPLGGWIASAPESIQGLGRKAGKPTTALFQAGGYYWVAGDAKGKTVKDVDLVVKVVDTGAAYDIGTCNFRTMEGGHASAKTVGHDQTFVAYDVEGKEVGRTTLKGDDCPGSAVFEPGQTLSVVPGNGEVRGWVETLLR
jgi:hypothetical protein